MQTLFLRTIYLLIAVTAVAGCESNQVISPVRKFGELIVDGRARTFLINVPTAPAGETKMPLVLMLHGTGGSATQAERDYGWTDKANASGFIVAYPEGVQGTGLLRIRTWNAGTCCQYAMENNIDDVKFIRTLIDDLLQRYPIDESRIYVAGMSNGAMLAYRLACEMDERFAAIASVSGTMMIDHPCGAETAVPFLHIHSLSDTKIPYHGGLGIGGYNFSPVDSATNVLRSVYACVETVATQAPGYTHYLSRGCKDGAVVELYQLVDGGHSWPGGLRSSPRSDVPSTALNATDTIWDFFNQHRKN